MIQQVRIFPDGKSLDSLDKLIKSKEFVLDSKYGVSTLYSSPDSTVVDEEWNDLRNKINKRFPDLKQRFDEYTDEDGDYVQELTLRA